MGEKQALVPRLRFPEFRNAGEWEEKPFKKLLSVGNGRDHKHLPDGDIPVYGSGGYMRSVNDYLYDGESVCIGRKGTIDKPIFLAGKFWTVDTLFYTHSFNNCIPRFAYLLFQNIEWKKHNEAGGVPSLSKANIEKIVVLIPGKAEEQQRIADCLSSLDELIAAQAEKIDALKTHKKGLMQQLFPREGETLPRLRFPVFRGAEEWVEKPLSVLVKSLDAGVSVNSGDRPAKENESGILKTSAVTAGVFEPKENKVVTDELEQSRLKEPVLKNTIIISRMNTPALVGANAYVTKSYENLYLPDRLWAAKPTSEGDIRFTAYILGSSQGRSSLSELATGTSGSMKNISKSAVLDLKVLVPSTEEQQKIAECLSSIDTLIAAHTEKLGTFKVHKKGLMQQLFPAIDRGGL